MGEAGKVGAKRGGFIRGDFSYKGSVSSIEPLSAIRNPAVYKATKEAVSRYHSVLGVRQREIKLADLPDGVAGVHLTKGGESYSVYLSKSLFKNQTRQKIEGRMKGAYKSGFLTKTNKPIAHTVTHELAHATWNQSLTTPQALRAGRAIKTLHQKWLRDKRKKGYGQYAKTNISEFFAETATKAVHGTSDRYTKKIKQIIRRYKL